MRKFLTIISILSILFVFNILFVQKDNATAGQLQNTQLQNQMDSNESTPFKSLNSFISHSGFANANIGNFIMILLGLVFIFIAIKYDYEPMLLIPIGFGILIGNIPIPDSLNFHLAITEKGSILNYLYSGILTGIFPSLIFLGLGAMTDFSTLISNPKLLLLGFAAQIGIFISFFIALAYGFYPAEAASVGIIGALNGPTSVFLVSKLANGIHLMSNGIVVKNLIAPVSIATYLLMGLVPVIQPPVMYMLTSKKERLIKMKTSRAVTRLEKIIFPIVGLLLTCFIVPGSLSLLGLFFFGNILKESGVTRRLAETSRTSLIDIITLLLGVTIGASAQASIFLTTDTFIIIIIGTLSFVIATICGIIMAKMMNIFLRGDQIINPLIGAAGVSAVPDSARVVHMIGLRENPKNHLLMHAMAPNVAGIIGTALAAGILLNYLL